MTKTTNPWKAERAKPWVLSNTVQSVAFPLLVCLGIAVLGRVYGVFSPEVQTAAEGGVVACIGALVYRVAVPKDKLTRR